MRLLDTNLLLYARFEMLPQHAAARGWLEAMLNAHDPVGIPWTTLLAYVRLASNRHILSEPISVGEAWGDVDMWLERSCVWIPLPGERHRALLGGILTRPGMKANDVPDAHLAALAMEHGLILCSADRGFARFAGLRWENPLE